MPTSRPTQFNDQYSLKTERLELRPFKTTDVRRIVEIFADEQVCKWVDDGKPIGHTRANRWVEASHESMVNNGSSAGAVIEIATQRMIGWGGIVHPQGTSPEILYGFEVAAWGKGYGREIAKAIVKDGQTVRNFSRLRATVDPENIASINILKSIGFALISSGLDENGLPTDVYRLG